MRRNRRWTIVLGFLLCVVALKQLPMVLAFTSASVTFSGNYTVGGTAFIACTGPAMADIKRPKNNKVDLHTATLTCVNRLGEAITVNIGSTPLSPAGANSPGFSWSTTSLSLPAGGSASATVTVTVDKNTTLDTYTYTLGVSRTPSGTELDFSEAFSDTFLVSI